MFLPRNTIEDFKDTANNRDSIICPSCGASLGFYDPNGFSLHLNPACTSYMNTRLGELRMFTGGLDHYLANHHERIPLSLFVGTPYFREEHGFLVQQKMIPETDGTADRDGDSRFPVGQEFQDPLGEFLTAHGEFRKTVSEDVADYFRRQVDTHDLIDNFDNLPRLPEPDADGNWSNLDLEDPDFQKRLSGYARSLLGVGLERRSNGLVFELICEQDNFRTFLTGESLRKYNEMIKKAVREIMPMLDLHYRYLESVTSSNLAQLRNEDVSENLLNNIQRARLLLLILHGHVYRSLDKEAQERIAPDDKFKKLFLDNLYSLPSAPRVSDKLLSRLVNSRVFLQNKGNELSTFLPHWIAELFQCVHGAVDGLRHAVWGKSAKNYPWVKHLEQLVEVHCANPIEFEREPVLGENSDVVLITAQASDGNESSAHRGRLLNLIRAVIPAGSRDDQGRPLHKKIRAFRPCGWSPSQAATYSVVVLGSPGTGKTALLQSGLSKLRLVQGAVGLAIKPEDDPTRQALQDLNAGFLLGDLRPPTEVDLRLNLHVQAVDVAEMEARFSLTDIPGEQVRSLVSGNGADAVLRRMLRHANVVVFQFDLWSDLTLLEQLQEEESDTFRAPFANAERIQQSRAHSKGYYTDQVELLLKLIDMLQQERGKKALSELPFICLFPKIDTLVAESLKSKEKPFIFTSLMHELHQIGVLIRGRNLPGVTESNGQAEILSRLLHTVAATGVKWDAEKSRQFLDDYAPSLQSQERGDLFGSQLHFCQALSNATKKVFREKMVDMLPDHVPDANKQVLRDRVLRGVIELIERTFGNSYFMPVSALGCIPNAEQHQERSLGHTPNPLFSEYVFLLPMMLSLKEPRPKSEPPDEGRIPVLQSTGAADR